MDRWENREREFKDDHSGQWVRESGLDFLGVNANQRL
jgi:hypothetical protein